MADDVGDKKKDYIIHTKNMTKAYGHLLALDSISLNIPYGAVGLLGPNGAGKSTLIKSLLGLVKVTGGTGSVLGNDIQDMRSALDIRQRIGYMPESDCLIPDLDAVELVKYMGELSGLPPMTAMQRAHEVLNYVGVAEERYRKVKTYSTGMKQKIKLAQAVVHDPELIFLDEPTNGMDPKGRQEMLDLINDISKNHGKNIIFSSHLLPDVEYICDYAVIIAGGRLILQGKIKDLTRSGMVFEVRIRGNASRFEEILKKNNVQFSKRGNMYLIDGDENTVTNLYHLLQGTDLQIRHAIWSKRTLEDIFVMNTKKLSGVGSR